jgi:type I restriction enzyme S subunit
MQPQWDVKSLREIGVSLIDCDHRTPPASANGVGYPYITIPQLKEGRIDLSDVRRISAEHFRDWTRKAKPQEHDVILSRRCNPGETAHVPAGLDCALGQNLVLLRSDGTKVFPPLLRWLVRSPRWWEQVNTFINVGAVFDSLKCADIPNFKVPLPPLPEQKAIAAVLRALDDKIELNWRMNTTLEAMARALFQSWFVDFDPVRAKLDGRQHPGLDAATSALFPNEFVDSELGQIPKGWTVTTLGACIGFRSGFSFKSQDWQESGVPVVKIGSVKPGIIDLTQVSYVSQDIAEQAARYRLRTGDMLIGMTGYVGEVGLVPPSDNPPLLNQRVGKFVMAKPGTESLAFWYCTTRQPDFKAFVEARSHGTAQANVSGESIMEFPVVAPLAEILEAFNRDVQPLLDRVLSNHAESRTLATLRDALLPKLLSGEIAFQRVSA